MRKDNATVLAQRLATICLRARRRKIDDPDFCAQMLAHLADTLGMQQEDVECLRLMEAWTAEWYWGLQVARHVAVFEKCYGHLRTLKARAAHPLALEEIESSAWIEPHDDIRILVIERYCASRDEAISVFLMDGKQFHARTVWQREKKWQYGVENWPHDRCWRDIAKPSLETYKSHQWKLGYGDSRDKGYCFSYNAFSGKVDSAIYHVGAISAALSKLATLARALDNLSHNPPGIQPDKAD